TSRRRRRSAPKCCGTDRNRWAGRISDRAGLGHRAAFFAEMATTADSGFAAAAAAQVTVTSRLCAPSLLRRESVGAGTGRALRAVPRNSLGGHRRREEEALAEIAAEPRQHRQLLRLRNPLRDH